MRLDNRISALEERTSFTRRHVLKYIVHKGTDKEKVKQEAIQAYCERHNLDPIKLEKEEYGEVLYLVNTIVSPGDIHAD
jgi:hypothetical protein